MALEEGILEEYKTLRVEILAQMDRRSSRLALVWAGISALLAVATVTEIPELGCIALLLVCSGWMDENRWFRNVIRIGTYISTVLEPKIEGLRWETIQYQLDKEQAGKRPLLRLFLLFFSTYGIFTIISIAFSIILYLEFEPATTYRRIGFFMLLLIGLIYSIMNLRNASVIPMSRNYWKERYSNFLNSVEVKE